MATSLKDKMNQLSPERRKQIEDRTVELIAEEMTLRDLRKAHKLTQERMAEFLDIGQDGVSRLEKRSDLLISTLRSYIEAMGGHLRIMAEFPDRPPIAIKGISEIDEAPEETLAPLQGSPEKSTTTENHPA